MSRTKVVVSEVPKLALDCPFAITCKTSSDYPCVCDLKRDKESDIRYGISFSHEQRENCTLTENGCDMLIAIN